MNYRARLNSLENKAKEIKAEVDSTVPVACGVWHMDEAGDIIKDSGPTCRVPKQQAHSFGILLAPKPMSTAAWSKSQL